MALKRIRKSANNFIGARKSARVLKQAYRERTLVLANNWDGSVQQFYHFILGYFFPLVLWLDRNRNAKIAVRDCGPMNIWFEALAQSVDIEIMQPGSALHIVIGNRMKHTVLRGMDDPYKFNQVRIVKAAQLVRKTIGVDSPLHSGQPHVLIIDRATSEDFYRGVGSETHMSGKERRHVPNLRDISTHMVNHKTLAVVDFAEIDPKNQIELAQDARVLVGQHGAGLAHMIWMPRKSHVIEIAPPLPDQVQNIFERLAGLLGHSYQRILQNDVHSPIDLLELEASINQALGN